MPHPEEKKRRLLHNNDTVTADSDFGASLDDLGVDVLADIYAFLPLKNIICLRGINNKSREAVRVAIPPPSYFSVHNMRTYNAMNVMATELPNLQQIVIGDLGNRDKWSDGEDPNEGWAARTADYTSHDIGIISNFNKLRILEIDTFLNGRYPVFFGFSLLQKLIIHNCTYLKWDLEMLSGLPELKEFVCNGNYGLTGTINSLRVLKDTLEVVYIKHCSRVEGNFMDLADFPRLKELDLDYTAVTGDIRDIGEHDFSALERLTLPKGVYGTVGYEFQSISDAPDLVRAVYTFNKQRPSLKMSNWYGILSRGSPDWYESADDDDDTPPLCICFVGAGSRLGYRWVTNNERPCEVNWLDDQPDRESSDYEEYIVQLEKIQDEIGMYRGFHQPPTEEEYHRLVEG